MVSCLYSTLQLPGASLASVEVLLTFSSFWVEDIQTDRPRDLDIEAPSRSLTNSDYSLCRHLSKQEAYLFNISFAINNIFRDSTK
jgi:hypothetical protein